MNSYENINSKKAGFWFVSLSRKQKSGLRSWLAEDHRSPSLEARIRKNRYRLRLTLFQEMCQVCYIHYFTGSSIKYKIVIIITILQMTLETNNNEITSGVTINRKKLVSDWILNPMFFQFQPWWPFFFLPFPCIISSFCNIFYEEDYNKCFYWVTFCLIIN